MKKQITAAVMMLSMIAPAMANGLDNQAFEDQVFHTRADAPMQLAELSQKEMKETEGTFLPLAILGGAAIGMWTQHGFSYATTGRPASVRDVAIAGGLGAIPGGVGAAGKVVSFAKYGREIKIGNNMRIAPFGNRTGHPIGKFPHYHRRVTDNTGKTLPGRELVVIALGNQNLRTDHGKTASNSSFFSI
ncbi:putative membrane protein [Neisseria meningitidis NM2795]|nr:putative membrane protein [Neisseria meningitidis NM2795]